MKVNSVAKSNCKRVSRWSQPSKTRDEDTNEYDGQAGKSRQTGKIRSHCSQKAPRYSYRNNSPDSVQGLAIVEWDAAPV